MFMTQDCLKELPQINIKKSPKEGQSCLQMLIGDIYDVDPMSFQFETISIFREK